MTIRNLVFGAVISAAGLAAMVGTTTAASAAVVCNRGGDCWHTKDRYDYKRSFGLTVHDDNWRWRGRDRYRWREHDGRGYWRNGIWLNF